MLRYFFADQDGFWHHDKLATMAARIMKSGLIGRREYRHANHADSEIFYPDEGGIETVTRTLGEDLSQAGHQADVLCFARPCISAADGRSAR